MKDLEQLEKKNKEQKNGGANTVSTPLRKKNTSANSNSDRKAVNYEDKIKELEAKLFGK